MTKETREWRESQEEPAALPGEPSEAEGLILSSSSTFLVLSHTSGTDRRASSAHQSVVPHSALISESSGPVAADAIINEAASQCSL